jgi:hypothetical protein
MVLFYDILRQSRQVAGISLVDADNCFNQVAHAVASLFFQAFGVSDETCGAMLCTIQEMQFFLRLWGLEVSGWNLDQNLNTRIVPRVGSGEHYYSSCPSKTRTLRNLQVPNFGHSLGTSRNPVRG